MADEAGVVEVRDHDRDARRHDPTPPAITSTRRRDDGALRILIITDFYLPYLGGVEQHVRSLGQSLAAAGHEVVIATLGRSDLPDVERDGDVTVRRLRSTTQRMPWLFASAERPWAPPFPDPAITWALRRIVARHRPHIVHGHDWLARSFLPLRRGSARRFGTRFVTSLHYYTLSCARKDLMHSPAGGRDEPCAGPSPRRCLACAGRHYGRAVGTVTVLGNLAGAAAERRGAAAIVAVSAAVATGNGLRAGAARVEVVPNFLPPPAASTTAASTTAASPGTSTSSSTSIAPTSVDVRPYTDLLPPGDFILFVGDLRPMKGVDVLLAAYAALDDAPPLVLVGKSWPDTPASFPDGVTVHDRWPNAAVIAAWRASAIAVVPSVWAEPFGIVVIEAMGGGCAVVASAVGGIPEIIEDGISGVLVAPGDVAQLRDAIAALVRDPQRRAVLGAAARERAAAYTAGAVVPQLVDVYRRALRTDGSASTS